MSWLFWLFMLALVAAAGVGGLLAYRAYVKGESINVGAWLFRPRPIPRLSVIEQASIDGKRRLVLVRRDDVEHLIMTGGPVDVVIETGIAQAGPAVEREAGEAVGAAPPVFARTPRSFGQAVNE